MKERDEEPTISSEDFRFMEQHKTIRVFFLCVAVMVLMLIAAFAWGCAPRTDMPVAQATDKQLMAKWMVETSNGRTTASEEMAKELHARGAFTTDQLAYALEHPNVQMSSKEWDWNMLNPSTDWRMKLSAWDQQFLGHPLPMGGATVSVDGHNYTIRKSGDRSISISSRP